MSKDEEVDIEIDEAGWTNQKMMKNQAASDAWRDAQKLAAQQSGSFASTGSMSPLLKKDPSEYDPNAFLPDPKAKKNDLKLAGEASTAGGSLVGVQTPGLTDEELEGVRSMVRQRVKEVVRKKKGGGGYVLYAPNKGKKGKPKAAGAFPTKLGAKRAELARFPPKDPNKLARLRKEVDRLSKDPSRAQELEKPKHLRDPQKMMPKGKKESVLSREVIERRKSFMERQIISTIIKKSLNESFFVEDTEKEKSEWDDYISKLSQSAQEDPKFKSLQASISKVSDSLLDDAFSVVKKSVGSDAKLKNFGIKKDKNSGQNFLAFSATMDNVSVEPIFIHITDGVPNIVLSSEAKVSLTKIDPKSAKLFRADLVNVQERVLDGMTDLEQAIQKRDSYLEKLQNEVDAYVSGLSPLQLSLVKQLLTKKYRKLK